jgi:translation initiation factor 4G
MAADKRFQGAKPETTTTSPVANSVSTVSTADGKSKEAIQRTGSFKDNKKNDVKKESKNSLNCQRHAIFC